MSKEDFISCVETVLTENVGDSLKQIKNIIKEETGVNWKNIFEGETTYEVKVKELFDYFNAAELKYNKSKKRTIITKVSPVLQKLIDDLNLDVHNNIILLTRYNAKKIEDKIKIDQNYFGFYKIIYQKYYNDFKNKEDIWANKEKSLFALLRILDVDNSTNVWRYKYKRDNFNRMLDYMVDPKNEFFVNLENGDVNLPDILSDNKVGGTAVKSFSSKVCHYISIEAFGLDNYYKNDKFIRAALPFYLDEYVVNHNIKTKGNVDSWSYKELHAALDSLLDAANKEHNNKPELTKGELDHIIWYCYKSFKAD
jgi:hypothetical protein